MARVSVLSNGSVRVIFTQREAEKNGLTARMGNVVGTPSVEEPATTTSKKPYECTVKSCYKFGHRFSEVGWFGNATARGHVAISPAHK